MLVTGWQEEPDLTNLSLEDLLQVHVTSVAGVAAPLQRTPAALFVIRPEDVRRGGHLSIPDALRMVPGANVGQVTSSIWAVSVRGFNDRFSTKLLVLVDGRAAYNWLFSGVFWDEQDVVLEDLDRIEVVRGPGATLWGSNAVNGVISVVTKPARLTQGLLWSGGGGSFEQGFGTVRYGGVLAEDVYFRVWGQYANRGSLEFSWGAGAPDDWDKASGGFRVDVESDPDTTVTVQGDAYRGIVGSPIVERAPAAPFLVPTRRDTEIRGANLLARVEHLVSETAGWTAQAYVDRAERDIDGFLSEHRDTVDAEFRHHFALGPRDEHALIWGLGFRHRSDETSGIFTLGFDPASDRKNQYSAFVQDTLTLVPERLELLLGTKLEHNDFTGFEIQPTARLAWTPEPRQTLWAAFARAVRTPSRANDALVFTRTVVGPPVADPPAPARLLGSTGVVSEELHAFEAGYRVQPRADLTFDVATFYNDYDRLVSIGAPLPSPLDVTFSNQTHGETYGVEVAARWDAASNLRLLAGYAFLQVQLHGLDEADEGTSPHHQLNLRSYLNLTPDLELNSALYYVDSVPASNADAYIRLDAGLTWRPRPNLELSVWGQNLLEPRHLEFVDPFFVSQPVEAERSVAARLTVRF
jgi:iron complex outermembrane receptor protein